MKKTMQTYCGCLLALAVVPQFAAARTGGALWAGDALCVATGQSVEILNVAEDSPCYFVVLDKQGGQVSFAVEDEPVVTFRAATATDESPLGYFVVESKRATLTFAAETVESFSLSATAEGGVAAVGTVTTAMAERCGDVFRLAGCRPGAVVACYDASGRRLVQSVADASGRAEISVTSQPAGVYVIKTETSSFKILKQ